MKPEDIKIDPELRDMLVPLSEDEEAKLEGSLMLRGCLSPLIVDSNTGVLVDGHNRYRICKANNIPFEIKEVDIGKKKYQKKFILINQLGRRNIDSTQRKKLVAELMDLVKVRSEDQPGFKEGHEFKGNQHAKDQKVVVCQIDTQPKQPKTAAEKVAEMTDISPRSANRYQKEVKEWKEHGLMDDINSGKLKDKEANKIIKEKKQKAKTEKQKQIEDEENELMSLPENQHLNEPVKQQKEKPADPYKRVKSIVKKLKDLQLTEDEKQYIKTELEVA